MNIDINAILYNVTMFFVVLVGAFIITKFLSKLAGDDVDEDLKEE